MGCALGRFHTHLGDLSKRTNAVTGSVTINANNLHTYLNPDNPNPKCIFVFGGSGSNKGEFIWDILQQSCENFLHNDNNVAAQLLMNGSAATGNGTAGGSSSAAGGDESSGGGGSNGMRLHVVKYSYYYIDVEKLIVDNLAKRIKRLCTNTQSGGTGHFIDNYVNTSDHHLLSVADSPDFFLSHSPVQRRRKSSASDELKTQLLLYANIVTNSWVLSLINKEIEENNFGPNERVFIINLIPNRITIFKNCLFLKQAPSFGTFNCNYIAVNLVKHCAKRKDLEIKSDEIYDEINSNFINYFRVINKLIDVRVDEGWAKLQFRLTRSKDAIEIKDKEQLISFLYMPKKDQLELNIFNFKFDELVPVMEKAKKQCLTFVINNQVDLDEGIVLKLEEKNINLIHVRKFVQLYKLIRYSINFT